MSTHSENEFTAIQAVVDRVGAYQGAAPEGTIETELREGLSEAGVTLQPEEITTLADAIEAADGDVQAADVLG